MVSLKRKGQAAMEYLATYGWAIMVVMVVGVAMWRMGIFNMGSSTMTSTGFAKIKPLLSGTGLTHNGDFIGVFTNGLGSTTEVTSVLINNTVAKLPDVCKGRHVMGGAEITPANPLSVSAGDNFVVYANNCGGTVSSSDIYFLNIYIRYTITIGSASTDHQEFGGIRGPYEQ